MTVDLVLYNVKVYCEGEIVDAGIAVEEGKIVKIAKEVNLPPASDRINLNRCLALPGLIDVHVHLRGQLQAFKEDFFTGTAAAIAGGITSILDMPNNKPVTVDSSSLRERMRVAKRRILANVGFYSAFPETLDEIGKVVREGAVAFKLYLAAQIGGLDINDDEALLRAFNRVSELGVPVAVHAEDNETVENVAKAEQRLGHNDVEAYLKAHTPEVEAKAVERILKIAFESNVQIHFCHISSKKAVSLIHNARKNGLRVSCEATPHQLLLTSEDLKQQGTMLLTDPPVRSKNIVEELWNTVRNGQVDIIASDHAPHLVTEKKADSVWDVKPGIPGLETSLPLLLTKVNEGQLTLDDLVRLTAEKPAEIFHFNSDGFLKEGYNANITVVDMHRRVKIDARRFCSKAKYSPFHGCQVKGMPVKTFVNGLLVMDEGEIVAEAGVGRVLRRQALR
ncbi:MAG: dihydroorotase family protein [Candidatus Bathyarchaeota archaeon]|nr:dihydroorotase family protein [Candidatus Bathyarchaeota archaeon]